MWILQLSLVHAGSVVVLSVLIFAHCLVELNLRISVVWYCSKALFLNSYKIQLKTSIVNLPFLDSGRTVAWFGQKNLLWVFERHYGSCLKLPDVVWLVCLMRHMSGSWTCDLVISWHSYYPRLHLRLPSPNQTPRSLFLPTSTHCSRDTLTHRDAFKN